MKLVPRNSIYVGLRQRSRVKPVAVQAMEKSISENPVGLIHPILVAPIASFKPPEGLTPEEGPDEGHEYFLVAGETRFLAMSSLHRSEIPFNHNSRQVPHDLLPVTDTGDEASYRELFEAEFYENHERSDLDWADQTRALAMIHKLKQQEDPAITKKQSAQEISEAMGEGAGTSPSRVRTQLTQAITVAPHLEDPAISNARNQTEAYNLVMRREADALQAERIRRRQALIEKQQAEEGPKPKPVVLQTADDLIASMPIPKGKQALPTPSPKSASALQFHVLHGDCVEVMKTLPDRTFDLILTDPPYGVGVHKTMRNKVAEHHNYEDTPENAKHILTAILREGHRITKNKANIYIFTDIDRWQFLQDTAKRHGWVPWRTPLIWQKSEYEGVSPWQRSGYIRTYDIIFWATKGQAGIRTPRLDIFNYKKVSRGHRVHGAEKPIDLLESLINDSTIPGDYVLDPCCGSGSALVAARDQTRSAMGIEADENYANISLARVFDEEIDPKKLPTIGEEEMED